MERQPDRRQTPRVLVDFEVDCASEDNYLFAYITDISATGIFIRTTTPEPPGTHLNLRFASRAGSSDGHYLDHDEMGFRPRWDRTWSLEGEVIWWNPYRPGRPDNLHPGMGVRFLSLSDEQRTRLVELVRRIAYLT